MSKKLVITSHNIKSRALKALSNTLSERLGYRVLRVIPQRVRNRVPVHFMGGVDKISQFQSFQRNSVACPAHTTTIDGVQSLGRRSVVARKLINASEGKGIVIFNKDDQNPPQAPLYTEYIPKKKEFRVHVFNNAVIDVAEKRKKKSFENERDSQIRNKANGYVFCRSNVVEPADIRDLAIRACEALGRTQGAVDIIWNEKENKSFVLEVNSRPGMEGTTLQRYADAIIGAIK